MNRTIWIIVNRVQYWDYFTTEEEAHEVLRNMSREEREWSSLIWVDVPDLVEMLANKTRRQNDVQNRTQR